MLSRILASRTTVVAVDPAPSPVLSASSLAAARPYRGVTCEDRDEPSPGRLGLVRGPRRLLLVLPSFDSAWHSECTASVSNDVGQRPKATAKHR